MAGIFNGRCRARWTSARFCDAVSIPPMCAKRPAALVPDRGHGLFDWYRLNPSRLTKDQRVASRVYTCEGVRARAGIVGFTNVGIAGRAPMGLADALKSGQADAGHRPRRYQSNGDEALPDGASDAADHLHGGNGLASDNRDRWNSDDIHWHAGSTTSDVDDDGNHASDGETHFVTPPCHDDRSWQAAPVTGQSRQCDQTDIAINRHWLVGRCQNFRAVVAYQIGTAGTLVGHTVRCERQIYNDKFSTASFPLARRRGGAVTFCEPQHRGTHK